MTISMPTTKPRTVSTRTVWKGERRFDAGPEGRTVPMDGDSREAPGPVESLLSALATCSGIDVVDILAKRRTPAEQFEVHATAERRAEHPRRLERVELEFQVKGPGIDPEQAEQAIQLSFEKYCSVAASLASDIQISARLVLNGERLPAKTLKVWTPSPER